MSLGRQGPVLLGKRPRVLSQEQKPLSTQTPQALGLHQTSKLELCEDSEKETSGRLRLKGFLLWQRSQTETRVHYRKLLKALFLTQLSLWTESYTHHAIITKHFPGARPTLGTLSNTY
jgi:hypothetical protein